jgi:hypothetical protein
MPMMPINRFFDPFMFGSELLYTLIIVFLCFLIYFKTKEIYDLTKHKGIHYFRNTFLFFGLAYISRFVLHLLMIANTALDIYLPRELFLPITILPVSYFSTMALFYLMYSLIWKKIENKQFLIFSNIAAILFSIVAFISRSPHTISILQLIPLAFTIIIGLSSYKKGKRFSNTRILYFLVILFWIINLIVLSPTRFFLFRAKAVFQIISVIIFIIIYYKTVKWTK